MRKINIQQPSEFAGKIFINLSHGHHNIPAVLPWVIVSSICSSLNVRRYTSIANIAPLGRHDRLPGKRRSKVHTRMLRNAHLLKKTRFDASVSTGFALILCFLCFVFACLREKSSCTCAISGRFTFASLLDIYSHFIFKKKVRKVDLLQSALLIKNSHLMTRICRSSRRTETACVFGPWNRYCFQSFQLCVQWFCDSQTKCFGSAEMRTGTNHQETSG